MTGSIFGTVKYGQELYGVNSSNILWAVLIDWANSGDASAVNYAARMVHLEQEHGRKNLLNFNNSGFEPMMTGSLFVILDNEDGLFDPFNGESELFPFVRPGVDISVFVRIPGETTSRQIFKGKISEIDPISGGFPQVRISAYDLIKYLREQSIKIKLNQNIDYDDAMGLVLDAANWAGGRDLEDSPDLIRYFYSDDDARAYTILQKLADASLGMFFVSQDGTAKYYERNRSTTSVLTINQADVYKEISIKSPWEVIKNVVSVAGHPREEQASTTLWTLYDKTAIAAGESIKLWGRFTYNGTPTPIRSYNAPASGTDYTFNSQPDGSGTNLTANLSVVVDVYPMSVEFTLTNTGGSIGYITLLKLRGAPLSETTVESTVEDSDSYQIYGRQAFKMDSVFLQDANRIIEVGTMLLTMLKNPQKYPTVKMVNHFDKQFALDLFDMVSLNFEKLGVGQDFNVSYIKHKWLSDNGQEVETEMSFEPANTLADDVWRFPTEIGITSKFAF